jgi:hypothetical protein
LLKGEDNITAEEITAAFNSKKDRLKASLELMGS